MKLSAEERKILGWLGMLLLLSAGVRLANPAGTLEGGGDPVDPDSLLEAGEAARAEAKAAKRALGAGEVLDPNTASPAELQRLPRVGPALAARIVEAREEAPFRTAHDLARVRGVSAAMAERLAPHLDLPLGEPASTRGSADRRREAGSRGASMAGAANPRPGAAARADPRTATDPGPVDVNRAGARELEALPGIGPALAARIVAHRDSAGPFSSLEELTRVRGIGPKMLEKLREHVELGP